MSSGNDGPPADPSHGTPATPKRRYDTTRRRQRAERERDATRRRVIDAAHRLFLERGYVATTMADIAREAGVAMQSVYNAGQSKADLLQEVAMIAVAGDYDDVLVIDRPFVQAIAANPDPVGKVELLAAALAEILERVRPVWVAYREAAAVDPGAAENLAAAHRLRRRTFGDFIALLPEDHLRRPPEESADAMWAIASVDVLLLLLTLPGWDMPRYADWLRSTLVVQLLTSQDTREDAGPRRTPAG